jgi:rhamnosyltransferase
VTVLLATHNGARWLDEQLDTILAQQGVDVRVLALDDASTDGTPELLARRADDDARITVLPSQGASGGAAPNFYRLIRALDLDAAGLVAFADQDDVWMLDKLARHAAIIEAGADGVSSNVTAFSADGPRSLIKKDYPQREFDYLLEGPGPGCTFLMSNRLVAIARELLDSPTSDASKADFHDWLLYVLCRSLGWRWEIDAYPSLDYRQHGSNAMGANVGAASARRRLALIGNRWHRSEAALLTRVALEVATPELRPKLERVLTLFERSGPRGRLPLLRLTGSLRRRPRDQAIIGSLVALGIW